VRAGIAAALLLISSLPALDATADGARLAVVIDDLGYDRASGLRAIALPAPVAVAVLPFAPHATELADRASDHGQDVIIHQPMESLAGGVDEPGLLTAEMPIDAFRRTLERAFDTLPQAIGVSNHTGSLLTARKKQMRWLMAEVQRRRLLFLDSRTTAGTVAEAAAIRAGIPAARRDVFLDHVVDGAAIAASFAAAIAIAHRQRHALLIAHPHDVSLALLEAELPALASRGVRQVSLREVVSGR
jgi:hypothetical protein